MNVKQLRNLLLDYPDDLKILIASDPEGNGFYRLVELDTVWIWANSDKHGAVEDVAGENFGFVEDPQEQRLVLWP